VSVNFGSLVMKIIATFPQTFETRSIIKIS
jgi:hypothetical protein